MKKYYVCGPTVYNLVHIGNMRPILTFDILIRAQKYLGENVFFLHNITDIDDKIINKSIELNISEIELANKNTELYLKLLDDFNILKPNKIARVTDSLNIIYDFINQLLEKGWAYKKGINVFFDVNKNKQFYGEISHQNIENMEYEQSDFQKNHPADFALWKDTQSGIKYDAPFGSGRPGWHTECVALINHYFDSQTIDIHGGGSDLMFPHNENENIQFRALNNQPLAKKWLHFGTLNLNNEKMSKSIGNIITAQEFIDLYKADTLRLIFLQTAYSKPFNLTQEFIENSKKLIVKFENIIKKYLINQKTKNIDFELVKEIANEAATLNFANVMKYIHQLLKNKDHIATFLEVIKMLGFNVANTKITAEETNLYSKWQKLLSEKNYQEADKIRDILISWNLI
ncbi:class I tRNA ligase family protein [Mycoplasma miroungirhinis]|uniref:Cysteine--tRNA ligase n=1 Tax=Mycoplasma miroungirhinis TaxID=754516 RepID=A0A6M4JCR5_9MOLU|nr:class I tRNA ligase family protein [Mycoplasma miroungirhinis]QJR43867.1 class I tRNA ligase family protein [Mycoplasma miroungirhinis]